MSTVCPLCGWKPLPSVKHPGRAVTVHMPNCPKRPQTRSSGKRPFPDIDMGEEDPQYVEPLHKMPRLPVRLIRLKRVDPIPDPQPITFTLQVEPPEEEAPQIGPEPAPEPEPPQGRPVRVRRFPPVWKDYEATSYTPITTLAPVNEEIMEQRVEPSTIQEPVALSAPDMAVQDSHRSPLNGFRVCRVSTSAPSHTRSGPPTPSPLRPSHPFHNDSIFEYVKQCCLGPSLKTVEGGTEMARLIASGRVLPRELDGYNARTELQRLDRFAASSKIGGGPWQTDSVKIRMPCARALKPTFAAEKDAPIFEVHGVRYRSLVDLLVAKVQDPSYSSSFEYTPFTEWWCPPGSTKPIWIYGEAYSSDVAVHLHEEIKAIPPPPEHPEIESVVVMLMLGSDTTHLAEFGTASLWPIYVLFGNMSKYDRSRTSEFAACHLAYLPKVPHMFSSLASAYHLAASSRTTLQIHTRSSLVSHPLTTLSPIAGGSSTMLWLNASSRGNLRRCTRMGSLLCSLMESSVVSFPDSTATQRTTQRSMTSYVASSNSHSPL